MNEKKYVTMGLFFIVVGIILGAMAAHYLEKIGIAADHIANFKVGTRYLFYNGIGALALAGIGHKFDFNFYTPFRFILWGTILFSGSIFALTVLPSCGVEIGKFLGPVTPLGGLMMILGWSVILFNVLRTYKS